MVKSKFDIKGKLMLELLVIAYLFIASLSNKYFFDLKFGGFSFVIWLTFCICIFIIEKKYNDIADEFSKSILAKVNNIVVGILFYSISIVSIIMISPLSEDLITSKPLIGAALLLILLVFTSLRLGLFVYYDRKGICD